MEPQATDTSAQNQPAAATTSDGTPVGASAPPVQTNEPAPVAKPDAPADWRTSLPDDLKADKSLETIKDVPSLAKSYLESRKMIGAAIVKPKEGASKDEIDAYYAKLGWEPDVTKVVSAVKGPILPQGLEMREEEISGFAKVAHGLRMNTEQIQGVLNYYGEFTKGVLPDYKGDGEIATKELSTEWGAAMDRNMGLARRALMTEFPKETVERITRTGLANDVGFIKGMYERGKGLIENGVIPEEVGQGLTTNSAQQAIKDMEGDPKSPLWNKEDPKHQDYVQKRANLYKVVYGSGTDKE